MKASSIMPPACARRVRGLAHIELALILMTMAVLLPLVFSFGRVFYVYSVVKQANSDAAASLATVPMSEWSISEDESSPMKARARQIARQALLEASIAPAINLVGTHISCMRPGLLGSRECGGPNRPSSITVALGVRVPVTGVMNMFNIGESIEISTTVTVPYTN
ncbi:TadE/TadG family type IV pilus assembly protein [Massilia rubra]|uniref:TadE-like domain-containing protein n=1 Tax=Massilia rubra TaxID=2607910 RepID=A0ABX0LTW0_9BURK|nr:TadE/TadG family type IV pilus assembly protein [Massilia rubra]NHZ34849.1 hypothetical protein [Massilia rubra]